MIETERKEQEEINIDVDIMPKLKVEEIGSLKIKADTSFKDIV